jgi:hypothetical protein
MSSELRVNRIIPVDGVPTGGGGGVIQIVTQQILTAASSATIPFDNTQPQSTEGFEVAALSITPKSTSNIILLGASFMIDRYNGTYGIGCLFRGTTLLNVTFSNTQYSCLNLFYKDSPSSTSSVTYSIRAGTNSGTSWVHSTNNGPVFGGNNGPLSNYFWAMEVSG